MGSNEIKYLLIGAVGLYALQRFTGILAVSKKTA